MNGESADEARARSPGVDVRAGRLEEHGGAVAAQTRERRLVAALVGAVDVEARPRRRTPGAPLRGAPLEPHACNAARSGGTGSRSVTSVPYASIVTASTSTGADHRVRRMRHFTPEEANAALDEVRPLVERLVSRRRAHLEALARQEELERKIRGNGGGIPPATLAYAAAAVRTRSARGLAQLVDEIARARRAGQGHRRGADRLPGASRAARPCCSAGSSARTRSGTGTGSRTATRVGARCRSTEESQPAAPNGTTGCRSGAGTIRTGLDPPSGDVRRDHHAVPPAADLGVVARPRQCRRSDGARRWASQDDAAVERPPSAGQRPAGSPRRRRRARARRRGNRRLALPGVAAGVLVLLLVAALGGTVALGSSCDLELAPARRRRRELVRLRVGRQPARRDPGREEPHAGHGEQDQPVDAARRRSRSRIAASGATAASTRSGSCGQSSRTPAPGRSSRAARRSPRSS